MSGGNNTPEHEAKIKQMKLSKFAIILIHKEKEEFGMWIQDAYK